MSCYLRHLDSVLAEAGIELTRENRKRVDQAIHLAVGVAYKECPRAWRQVKARLTAASPEHQVFIEEMRKAYRACAKGEV
ncbi:MAG: hypothetical protein HYX92_19260 [Chloroflexi bacterium]|nr:hypothetical protein [Chloroflexota bacterium]